MNITADPEKVIQNLSNRLANEIKENAFYLSALGEAQEKIKELEEKLEIEKG